MSLILSSAPHIRTGNTTARLMGNVLIALAPCAAAGVYFFGLRAAIVLAVSTASAVLAEFVWQKLARQKVRISGPNKSIDIDVAKYVQCDLKPQTIYKWLQFMKEVIAC